MVVGDLNTHNPAWGCSRFNARGNSLLDLFEDNDIAILNNSSSMHFKGHYSTEINVSAVLSGKVGISYVVYG